MLSSTGDISKTFELVRKRIPYKIVMKSVNVEEVLLQSEIKDLEETAAFIKAYETVTHSNFYNISNKTAPISPVDRRKWNCSHSIVSGLNKKCPASISILINASNNENLPHGVFLRSGRRLPAVIKINPSHNHTLVVPLSSYKLLKINNDVKMCFYEYFKRGYFCGKAKLLHEQNLQKANFLSLEDESMNPTLRAIYTLGNNWLKMKENMEVDKASDNGISGSLQATNVQKENEMGQFSSQNVEKFINIADVVSKLKKEPDDEHTVTENIPNEIEEDIKPVLTIKQEIIDDDENEGLPVISSYGSLAVPSPPTLSPQTVIKTSTVKRTTKIAAKSVASVVKVQPSPSQVILCNPSSNAIKVVKCFSVNGDAYSASQYKSYLPSALSPMRISFQKL